MYKVMCATLITLFVNASCIGDDYIFSSDRESERLNLIQEILKDTSIDHLGRAGLKKGMVVWDIFCGNGAMTEAIANLVGDTGHVYALDSRSDQISKR